MADEKEAQFRDIAALLQLDCAQSLRWLIDDIVIGSNSVSVRGWALPLAIPPEKYRFTLNGKPFDEVQWPISSPDLAKKFPLIAGADRARFNCVKHFATLDEVFHDGYARLDWHHIGPHPRSYRNAWYFPDPRDAAALPSPERIVRIIGSNRELNYTLGGATLFNRTNGYLVECFKRPVSSFRAILDWGCGSGRLTRHLRRLTGPKLTGCDIDYDNINWCSQNLAGVRFETTPLLPPTRFENGEFDLVFGFSVFTHLDEPNQFSWLQELTRIIAPGGLALVSVEGRSAMSLYGFAPQTYASVETEGFVDRGLNGQLDGIIEGGYYRNVSQSRDYIFSRWSEYFEVVDIIDALPVLQDLVVLRRR